MALEAQSVMGLPVVRQVCQAVVERYASHEIRYDRDMDPTDRASRRGGAPWEKGGQEVRGMEPVTIDMREGGSVQVSAPCASPDASLSRQGEKHMAAPPVNTPQIEKIFKDSTWQAQAERPDILGQLGSKWNEFLAGKGQGLKTYVDDLQLAYKMLRDPNFQMAKETKTILIIALLYIISPIDLIPDAIPLLGLVDDVLVAGYALRHASAELERYRQTVRMP